MLICRLQLLLSGLLILCMGCSTPGERPEPSARPVTTIEVRGPNGSLMSGHYTKAGQQYAVTNSLPARISVVDLSEFQIRKANLDDTITVHAHQLGIAVSGTAGPGIPGFHLGATNGLELHPLAR